MTREYEIEAAVVALEAARKHAIAAGLDAHFISEVEHLVATAKANRENVEATFPPCEKRKTDANGMAMCYAIGVCELGDMACECYGCESNLGGGKCKRREREGGAKGKEGGK